MATPATFVRYTAGWRGSFMAWKMTPQTPYGNKARTLPGLRNFYMAGHWVESSGGVCSAARSGCQTVKAIIAGRRGSRLRGKN